MSPRWIVAVCGVTAVLLAGCAAVAVDGLPRADREPRWTWGEDTPQDLRDLAEEVMADVATAFPSQRDCIGSVELHGAWELADRARYLPREARVTVRIPATAPQLRISLVHELAHHLEFSCPDQQRLRAGFLDAQGSALPAGIRVTGWFEGTGWRDTPSEQWATAVVRYVLGTADPQVPVTISSQTVELIGRWAGDGRGQAGGAPFAS